MKPTEAMIEASIVSLVQRLESYAGSETAMTETPAAPPPAPWDDAERLKMIEPGWWADRDASLAAANATLRWHLKLYEESTARDCVEIARLRKAERDLNAEIERLNTALSDIVKESAERLTAWSAARAEIKRLRGDIAPKP
jgi:hypothetical protein